LSATDWSSTDFSKVAAVLSAASISVKSSNWRGIFDPNTIPNPLPAASADLRHPTVFVTWDIAYTEIEGVFDDDADPVRKFVVVLAVWSQAGATRGHALDLFTKLRQAFTGVDGDSVVFFPTTARPQPLAERDGWPVEVLPIEAMGGVAA